jgi:serine protease AprX
MKRTIRPRVPSALPGRVFTILVVTCALASALTAGHPKISDDLEKVSPTARVDVIVRFKTQPTEVQNGKVSRRGGLLKSTHKLIKSGTYSLDASQLTSLADDTDVEYIAPDRVIKTSLDYANPAINANVAFQAGYAGQNVGVAIIDSGIRVQSDVQTTLENSSLRGSRIAYSESFVPGDKSTDDPYGHGTHVAGILGGSGASSSGTQFARTFRGIAPSVRFINLRVLNADGTGSDSAIIAAVERAIDLKSKYNIRVINLSLGRPVFESYKLDPLCQAVEAAWKAGIVVVVAAGNEGRNNSFGTLGYGTIMAPGNDPYVITVGAMRDMHSASRADDQIASYSSKGPSAVDLVVKPDLVAPGNQIISLSAGGKIAERSSLAVNLIPKSYYIRGGDDRPAREYYKLSGTSMAAPMVSGAAALLLQQRPTLTPDQVKAILMKTATKNFPSMSMVYDDVTRQMFVSFYDIFTVGAGYLDVWAALNSNDVPSGSAASPSIGIDPTTRRVQLVGAASAVWGSSGGYSLSAVWGSSFFLGGSSAAWGNSAVWGNSAAWGNSAVWGNSAAWGNSATWGSSATWGNSAVWGMSGMLTGDK